MLLYAKIVTQNPIQKAMVFSSGSFAFFEINRNKVF